MPIFTLGLKDLGPFDEIDFEFDRQVNVFVGPNNCGKSTVLMALADIAVYPFMVPDKLLRTEAAPFVVCKGASAGRKTTLDGSFPIWRGTESWPDELFNRWTATLKDLGYSCLVPALRWSTDYRAEAAGAVRTKTGKKEEPPEKDLVAHRDGTVKADLAKRKSLITPHPSVVRDEMVVQRMIDLDYRGYRERKPVFREILRKIATIASEITDGFPIEFAGVGEDEDGLYPEFRTPDGKVPLNVLSQGTQSIIQWLGLLLIGYAEYYGFPDGLEKKHGVVIIDEIDAHMHPSWQRRILPTLSRNFPKLQIFCSSHSPLVLAGLKAGQAQLLNRDRKGKVVVSRNETDIIGWSTDEILRNFLDLDNPTDLETSQAVERLQELRNKRRLTAKQKKELEKLRETVGTNLLGGPVASQIEQFAEELGRSATGSSSRRSPTNARKGKKAPTARKRLKKATSKGA